MRFEKAGPAMILISALLSACGADTVNITLLTPIPLANPTQDLSKSLIHRGGQSNTLVTTLLGPSCKQRDLRAGFGAPGWNIRWVPVALDTELIDYDSEALGNQINEFSGRQTGLIYSTATAVDHLNTKSVLRRPIVIPVPKNVLGQISIQGAMVEPIDADGTQIINTDGNPCARLTQGASPIPVRTFSVYGLVPYTAKTTGTLNLPIKVLQTLKPAYYGLPTGDYTVPNPAVLPMDTSNSDIKCKDLGQPASCANRHLFHAAISSWVSPQIWIRFPPSPDPGGVSIRIYNSNGQSNPALTDYSNFYIPKESPFLLSYFSGVTREVSVQFFQGQISYQTPGGRVSQPMKLCNQGFSFFAAAVPTVAIPEPTPVQTCSSIGSSYNFAIRDFGQGFN